MRVIEETAVCSLDAARADGFTLLHLAAQQGYPNMMHRLLSLKVWWSVVESVVECGKVDFFIFLFIYFFLCGNLLMLYIII